MHEIYCTQEFKCKSKRAWSHRGMNQQIYKQGDTVGAIFPNPTAGIEYIHRHAGAMYPAETLTLHNGILCEEVAATSMESVIERKHSQGHV